MTATKEIRPENISHELAEAISEEIPSVVLRSVYNENTVPSESEWVTKNTAILIFHGIGNQLPLETLDQFGRGLAKEYSLRKDNDLSLHHCVIVKDKDSDSPWFDNIVRIKNKNSPHHIDIYEYYWANFTEDQASWTDISNWINGVVKGAKGFYKEQAALGKEFNDRSIFFDSKGQFNPTVYWLVLGVFTKIILLVNLAISVLLKLLSYIPLIGSVATSMLNAFLKLGASKLANVLGDICIYNVIDPKSKFYEIRRKILDGAVDSIKFLIEKRLESEQYKGLENKRIPREYESVIIAGHSLGSQVSYDAINKINLLVNQEMIDGYDAKGNCNNLAKTESIKKISDQLRGFVTFGSPLDKIVFFLREKTPPEQIFRQQLIEAYHCFKQQRWSTITIPPNLTLSMCIVRYLDDIGWRNYYDKKDYVSGRLDYYKNVANVQCDFPGVNLFSFTHSNYWEEKLMYRDLIKTVINA
ncbi:hypothetical protein [Chryseolinea lacunae]|uniref:Uncharacterized protein n=1 Tax=Chryseolinea lacunae TaxID=2801331 RepID=A0ABS1L2D8_9BACT|nr:hypothetical protein [Chryseolinea lacunae]MBL0745854.1 hypothetical protein [Chryseolinea lacunae]